MSAGGCASSVRSDRRFFSVNDVIVVSTCLGWWHVLALSIVWCDDLEHWIQVNCYNPDSV